MGRVLSLWTPTELGARLRPAAFVLLLGLTACGGAAAPGPSSASASATTKPSAVSSAGQSQSAPASVLASSGQALPQLTIPYTAISVTSSPLWVTLETGQFAKYGLDVKTEYIPTSTALTPAMLSGQIPVANNSEDALINANLAGGDLAIIAAGADKFVFSVYTKSLANVSDLKGKKIGITRIGAATDFAARFVLAKNNLTPDKDVALLQIGSVPEILAGILSGAVDAGVLSPPTTAQARKANLKPIANLSDYDVRYYTGPIAAKKPWLRDHRDLGLKVVQAYAAGIAVIHRDKETTMRIIGKYSKTDDAAVLEDAYSSLLPALPRVPLPKVDAIQTGLAQASEPNAKTADPASFINPSLVEELQASGFIDNLYK